MCVFTHTHMWRSHGRSSLGKAEKGEVTCPRKSYGDIWGKIPNRRVWVLFFQRQSRIASARFTPSAISSYWRTIGRLGELVLMLENLQVIFSCLGTFKFFQGKNRRVGVLGVKTTMSVRMISHNPLRVLATTTARGRRWCAATPRRPASCWWGSCTHWCRSWVLSLTTSASTWSWDTTTKVTYKAQPPVDV